MAVVQEGKVKDLEKEKGKEIVVVITTEAKDKEGWMEWIKEDEADPDLCLFRKEMIEEIAGIKEDKYLLEICPLVLLNSNWKKLLKTLVLYRVLMYLLMTKENQKDLEQCCLKDHLRQMKPSE